MTNDRWSRECKEPKFDVEELAITAVSVGVLVGLFVFVGSFI